MNIRYNKTDRRYWTKKVSFHTKDSRTYSFHIQHGNERRRIGLKTTDKEQARALALEFYLKLRALGWEGALRWWKKGDDSTSIKKSNVTIGDYVDAVREKSLIHPKTLESYGAALRKIASDIAGFDSSSKRSTWRAQVDNKRQSVLGFEHLLADNERVIIPLDDVSATAVRFPSPVPRARRAACSRWKTAGRCVHRANR
jgi:hypothetical protein